MSSKNYRCFINHLFTGYTFLKCQERVQLPVGNCIQTTKSGADPDFVGPEAYTILGDTSPRSKDNMRYKSDDLFRIRKSTTKITADSRSFLQRFLEPFTRDTNREMLSDSNLDSPLHLKLTVTPRNLTLTKRGTLKL